MYQVQWADNILRSKPNNDPDVECGSSASPWVFQKLEKASCGQFSFSMWSLQDRWEFKPQPVMMASPPFAHQFITYPIAGSVFVMETYAVANQWQMGLSECMLKSFLRKLLDASIHNNMSEPMLRKARQRRRVHLMQRF